MSDRTLVCRHCAVPLFRYQERWYTLITAGRAQRFCPRSVGRTHAKVEHSPVPLDNPKRLEQWLAG